MSCLASITNEREPRRRLALQSIARLQRRVRELTVGIEA